MNMGELYEVYNYVAGALLPVVAALVPIAAKTETHTDDSLLRAIAKVLRLTRQ